MVYFALNIIPTTKVTGTAIAPIALPKLVAAPSPVVIAPATPSSAVLREPNFLTLATFAASPVLQMQQLRLVEPSSTNQQHLL